MQFSQPKNGVIWYNSLRGGAQPAPGTVGEAELDVRQREIDAITPDDFAAYWRPGIELAKDELDAATRRFPVLGRLEAAFEKVLREVRIMPLEAVRALALEIALLGANGISPRKKYNLRSMPNRHDIMGSEILAYYYVTWAKVFPDKLDMIGLPYKKAYDSAVAMLESLSGGG